MSDDISFRLFGEGGFINPTQWSYASTDSSRQGERWGLMFYDHRAGKFLQKQTQEFDGGWRWFDAFDIAALTVYNVKLERRAYTHITHEEIEDTFISAEFVLFCAKSRVVVEHNYYTAREYVLDSIKAMFQKARIEIMKEISGDPHLHSV
jgi:hypothetical protein